MIFSKIGIFQSLDYNSKESVSVKENTPGHEKPNFGEIRFKSFFFLVFSSASSSEKIADLQKVFWDSSE